MSLPVLVTGGYGYVGGRLAQHLVGRGVRVRLGTRVARDGPPSWAPEAEPVVADLADPPNLRLACRGASTVVHLAATNEIDSAADPAKAHEVNTLGTERMLAAAIAESVVRFVYLSTAHVYGDNLSGTVTEETPPRPVHPYAATHLEAERAVLDALRSRRIEAIVLRLSNGFGRPAHPAVDRWTLLVNDLCRQATVQHRLALRSSGLRFYDFITIEDACRGISHVARLDASAIGDGLFNLGGEYSCSVRAMAERVSARAERMLGAPMPLECPDAGEGERATPLDYRIDKLKATSFALLQKIDEEIDATLELCRKVFGGASES